MTSPDRKDFRALARNHAVVPVWRELLADLTTPVSLYARCVGDGEGFSWRAWTEAKPGDGGRSLVATRL